MSLTFSQLKSIASRVLGKATSDSDLPHSTIVNAAGVQLYNMCSWQFRERDPVSLSFVADQDHVELPADFGKVTAYALNGLTQDFSFTTPQIIANYRDHAIVPTGFHWWGAIVQPRQASQTQVVPPKRVQLYPTPTSGDTVNLLKMWYMAKWWTLVDDDHIAAIPEFIEPLLISLVHAFALAWIDDQIASPAIRVQEIKNSGLYSDAVDEDGTMQPDYGTPRRGAATERDVARLGYLPYEAPSIAPAGP